MKKVIVCSPSTKKYLKGDKYIIVKNPPKIEILEIAKSMHNVTAIGGGAVIDVAKIISKEPIICYPTTAAGSSDTSHSVYWDGTAKKNFKSSLPSNVIIEEEFIKDLPEKLIFETKCDLISHCLDSLWSKNKTKESEIFALKGLDIISNDQSNYALIKAGRYGGKAIEITKTNLLHALSYPLTGIYGISHGKGLSYLIPRISNLMDITPPEINYSKELIDINWELVVNEAVKYKKFFNTVNVIDKEKLIKALK